jgi:hypothetical protein
MPTQKHSSIKKLILDIESNLVGLSTTAKQILDPYPDIKEAYEKAKNWSSFWCALQKEHINPGYLGWHLGQVPPQQTLGLYLHEDHRYATLGVSTTKSFF